MNHPVYTTKPLLLDKYHAESTLLCIVHTLLFHRMIYKSIRPKEVAHPHFESIYYVMMDDPILHQTILEKIRTALETLYERVTGTVSILFYHLRSSGGWFNKQEQIEMERWNIPIQWYSVYDQSHTLRSKELCVMEMYHSLLSQLLMAPPPLYQVLRDYLPFDILDSDQPNRLKELLHFILSGPPKLGVL